MNATTLDDRRRLVMPPEFKPKSAVTVELIDKDTALVRLAKHSKYRMIMLEPDIKHFPDDPEWEKIEHAMAQHASKNLPPFDEL